MRRALLALLSVLIAAAAGAVLWGAWRSLTPIREAPPPYPPDADLEEVRFPSRDGTRLFGVFLRGRKGHPGIVLCHGYFKSLAEPLELGLRLNREGYNVLLFDFRGCGRSRGRFTTIGYKETWDVLAAVAFLRSRLGDGPIGVLGISMGAAAAIIAAAETADIAALVVDSPYAHLEGVIRKKLPEVAPFRWLVPFGWLSTLLGQLLSGGSLRRVRPVEYVGRLSPRPILFIFSELDTYIPHDHFRQLFDAAGEPKEMWVAPGSDHAVARLDYPEEYMRRVLEFFGHHLSRRRARRPERSSASPAHPSTLRRAHPSTGSG